MPGTEQHGIEVLIQLQMLLVECELAVARVRSPDVAYGGEAFRAEIGAHVLDPPQPVRSGLGAKAYGFGCAQKVGLDVPRHEPPFFRFEVCLRERREVHMRSGQGDAGGVLVQLELVRIDSLDGIEVVVEAAWFVGDFAEHVRQVDLVQRQHLADDVEYTVTQCFAHPVQLAQQALEDASFDDRFAILGGSRDEVERVHVARLSDSVNSPQSLFETGGVPGQVVVDHEVAELEVDAFSCRLGRHAYLPAGAELLLRLLSIARVHPAVDFAGGIAPGFEMLTQVVQRIAVLGEHEQFSPSVLEFVELGTVQTLSQRNQLGVAATVAYAADVR